MGFISSFFRQKLSTRFAHVYVKNQFVGSTNWTEGTTSATGASSEAQRQDEWLQQLWPFAVHGQATLQAHTELINHVYPGCSNGVADEEFNSLNACLIYKYRGAPRLA